MIVAVYGMYSDHEAISYAQVKTRFWDRHSTFEISDIMYKKKNRNCIIYKISIGV